VGEELDNENFLFLKLLFGSDKNTKKAVFEELEEFFENK